MYTKDTNIWMQTSSKLTVYLGLRKNDVPSLVSLAYCIAVCTFSACDPLVWHNECSWYEEIA